MYRIETSSWWTNFFYGVFYIILLFASVGGSTVYVSVCVCVCVCLCMCVLLFLIMLFWNYLFLGYIYKHCVDVFLLVSFMGLD
jgi:hypothetical protein